MARKDMGSGRGEGDKKEEGAGAGLLVRQVGFGKVLSHEEAGLVFRQIADPAGASGFVEVCHPDGVRGIAAVLLQGD